MKITKKAFVEAMTGNETIFAGIVRGVFDVEYTKKTLQEQMERIRKEGIFVEKRTCKARSRDLAFSGGSYLGLEGKTFFKEDCGNCIAYICNESISNGLGEVWEKRLVYVVEK